MYTDLKLDGRKPAYLQIKDYLKDLILKRILQTGARLPATRELSGILKVSRNTVILAYQYLEDDGFIKIVKNQGAFVAAAKVAPVTLSSDNRLQLDWSQRLSDLGRLATALDIEKRELKWRRGMISFKSIAPDGSLFETDEVKKAFLNRLALEGQSLLNYGYAKGYKPLIDYLFGYMASKGVNPEGKDILITNGFTEAFNLILSALTQPGEAVICENPTHNTALKIMKLHGLAITGIPLREDGMDVVTLEQALEGQNFRLGYIIPSYHNPTGIVMPLERRLAILQCFTRHQVPLIEDGFNEELKFSGSHVAPLLTLAGSGNSLIYLGSFSKVLFPGLRIGWIMCDSELVSYLESLKRSGSIHTSVLDQAVLCEYLQGGHFETYLKKVRRVYKERYEAAVKLATKLIPCKKIWGQGGLHIFIELEGIDARKVLTRCYQRGVVFMPGDIFFTNGEGANTFRLGIGRVTPQEMEAGFRIIGDIIRSL